MDNFDKVKQELDENHAAKMQLVAEMLSFYSPVRGNDDPDIELSSVDLADQFADTVEITPDALAVMMAKAGFHVQLRGSKFLWQLKVNK